MTKEKLCKLGTAFILAFLLAITAIWSGFPMTDAVRGEEATTTLTSSSMSGTMTITLEITGGAAEGDVSYDKVAVTGGEIKDITGVADATDGGNPFETKIENSNELGTLLGLSDEDIQQGVNVWLDVQDVGDTVSQSDKTLILQATDDYTVGVYLDLNLFKKVGENNAEQVTGTNGKIKASILVPESMWKEGRSFEIIRVHDGETTVITGTYDETTHMFTFESDAFSTYALAYKDEGDSTGQQVIYRLYLPSNGEHLMTPDANEVKVLTSEHEWVFEGIAWYAPATSETPVYRLYNPGLQNHLYTSDLHEIDVLTNTAGWVYDNDEKPLFYSGGEVSIYRLYNFGLMGMHLLTTDSHEYDVIPEYGWEQEGIVIYAEAAGKQMTLEEAGL